MKLLISAYACAPNHGSEHGSAWHWAVEANRLGHRLCVMVSPAHKDSIAAAVRQDAGLAAIHWVFPELRFWPLRQGKEPRWERTYNLLWQMAALRSARALQRAARFDAVHHLTWGGLRAPTFLGKLGVPLIIGPIGGGETSPKSLRDRLPLKGRLLEALRDLSNATIEINPIVRHGLRSAALIVARTTDTRNALSPALRGKTAVLMELGVSREQIGTPRARRESPRRLLFAGRLLYWKGLHIAIEAMALLVQRMPDAHLTVVGNGPEERRFKAEVARRNLGANIAFVSRMPQDEFFRLYDNHDLLIFPSLHDSEGWVVLEALCHGMPVACLDLGGPKDIVTPRSGIVIGTAGLATGDVAARLADQLHDLLGSPARMQTLSAGAIDRSKDFILSDRVTQLYDKVRRVIERGSGAIPERLMETPPAAPEFSLN